MNDSDQRLDALFAAARAHPPDTSTAEFAFETRLAARLRESRSVESIWAKVSWRLMPFFAVFVLGLAVWHQEAATETSEAVAFASLENPDPMDLWDGLK